jgi:molybdopterin/thiamine biosynthesis adenylyltransferase
MVEDSLFSYDAAFERNIGWLTEADQLALRGKRIAIAGMGGVGGVHLLTLARFGFGAFTIADFDEFALANFNRQIGANLHTIDWPKAKVLEEMALAINPQIRLTRFDEGVTEANLDAFLADADLYVDGLDFFVLETRRKVFARCHERGIPTITAAPIGMGTSLLAFVPDGMSFEQYFRLEGRPELEQYLRFLIGLAPRGLHRPYLVDPSRLNLEKKSAPSTGASCQLAAGVTAVMAVKLLLGRGDIRPAPWSHHYDPYRGILAATKLRNGLNGPLQRLKIRLALPALARKIAQPSAVPPTFVPQDVMDEILHAARWTPSGDNEQPWRFEKPGPDLLRIHLMVPAGANPYYYRDSEPNILAIGMLLESLRIAAAWHQRRITWQVRNGAAPLQVDVRFSHDPGLPPDPLYAALGQRSVDRNRYRSRKLTAAEQTELEAALDGQLRVDWRATAAERWQFARLSALATSIRLRAPEAFPIHQRIIDWDTNLSATKIPAGALGLDRPTQRIMRWGLHDLARTRLLNRLGGTVSAMVQMDYLPILSSAAVFTLRFPSARAVTPGVGAVIEAGQYIQRFWLRATKLGLVLQPALAVLAFARYGEKRLDFTMDDKVQDDAARLSAAFRDTFNASTDEFVFMGRIGEPLPRIGVSRSVRRQVTELMLVQ